MRTASQCRLIIDTLPFVLLIQPSKISAELHSGHQELQLIHERDVAENREILQMLLLGVDGLRDVINEPSDVRSIMQTIQEVRNQCIILLSARVLTYLLHY